MNLTAGPESPLLTIAIPTYNRARYLERSLAALADQIPAESQIELVVSDNASTDETPSVVDGFKSRGLSIRYLQNESNLGPDRNILQCYEQAKGKYVWILGDDDFLRPGGIAKVLSHLQAEEYDLVYIASVSFTDSDLPPAHVPDLGIEVFERADLLARRVNIFFTFISGNIVNKERVSSVPHLPFSELVDTFLIQLGWIYAVVDHNRRSLFIRAPLVAAMTENTGGYRLFRVFGPNLKRITDERIRSPRVRRAVLNGALQRFFPQFLLTQKVSNGEFVRENPHEILAPVFGDNLRYWWFDFPITWMPLAFAKCWLLMVRVVNRVDTMLGNPLLGS
jgi:abequosyltransferase